MSGQQSPLSPEEKNQLEAWKLSTAYLYGSILPLNEAIARAMRAIDRQNDPRVWTAEAKREVMDAYKYHDMVGKSLGVNTFHNQPTPFGLSPSSKANLQRLLQTPSPVRLPRASVPTQVVPASTLPPSSTGTSSAAAPMTASQSIIAPARASGPPAWPRNHQILNEMGPPDTPSFPQSQHSRRTATGTARGVRERSGPQHKRRRMDM